ncbi:MAG: phenylacetaldoxime dehydratase family protein [Beijerinckiaceae bacterium]
MRCPRLRTRRVSDNFKPPVPMWSARADESVTQMVMGYFGVQSEGEEQKGRACKAFQGILDSFLAAGGPRHHDLVHYVDAAGYNNMIAIAYWDDPLVYERWRTNPAVAGWWESKDRLNEGIGYFRETLAPRVEQFETIFTAKEPLEGVGIIMGGMSDEILEHGYWGAMRDRFPLSQTDTMEPSGDLAVKEGKPALGGRVVIAGHQNLAVIRSGQDWTETEGEERRTYLEDIEPTLRAGMDYLRDDGLEAGCYSNRYVRHMDAKGNPVEKSFGVSHWRSLEHLEHWASSHPTHLSIFVTFNRLAKKFKNLKLYHEVSVFDPAAQLYEYVNCHPGTGLMRAAL